MRTLRCVYNRNTYKQNRYMQYVTVDWYNLEHNVTKYGIDACAKKYNTGTVLYSTRGIVQSSIG